MKRLLITLLVCTAFAFTKSVYIVPISGTIDLGLPPYIQRSITEAEQNNASAIIFEINTFGGRVDAATQIKDAIINSKVKTIAFINKRAISAGALISLSCENIFMTGGSTIGATTAVDMSGKKGSEKVISYMREEMATTAEKWGRNTDIARGMVDEELEFKKMISYKYLTKNNIKDTTKISDYFLIINNDTIIVDDIEGRKKGNLITLTTNQALKYNFADFEAESINEILDTLNLADLEVIRNSENWSEAIVRFLTNPVVASLLTTFGFLGILFEIQSPGWGVAGSIGLICLTLSLGSSFIAGLATITEFLVIIAGLLFIGLEALVIPGFGITGIAGIIIFIWGLYLLLIPSVPVGQDIINEATNGLLIGIVGSIAGLVLIMKAFIKSKFWSQLTAPGTQNKEDGYSTSVGWETLIGESGEATTDLHPSGWVNVNKNRIFVVSEGKFIENKSKIIVISVQGNRVVVRKQKK